jgi:hypothetical protein
VLCLIVLPLPPGKPPSAVEINNNNNNNNKKVHSLIQMLSFVACRFNHTIIMMDLWLMRCGLKTESSTATAGTEVARRSQA